jgi:hypothetical protein
MELAKQEILLYPMHLQLVEENLALYKLLSKMSVKLIYLVSKLFFVVV